MLQVLWRLWRPPLMRSQVLLIPLSLMHIWTWLLWPLLLPWPWIWHLLIAWHSQLPLEEFLQQEESLGFPFHLSSLVSSNCPVTLPFSCVHAFFGTFSHWALPLNSLKCWAEVLNCRQLNDLRMTLLNVRLWCSWALTGETWCVFHFRCFHGQWVMWSNNHFCTFSRFLYILCPFNLGFFDISKVGLFCLLHFRHFDCFWGLAGATMGCIPEVKILSLSSWLIDACDFYIMWADITSPQLFISLCRLTVNVEKLSFKKKTLFVIQLSQNGVFKKNKRWGWKVTVFPMYLLIYIVVFLKSERGERATTRRWVAYIKGCGFLMTATLVPCSLFITNISLFYALQWLPSKTGAV